MKDRSVSPAFLHYNNYHFYQLLSNIEITSLNNKPLNCLYNSFTILELSYAIGLKLSVHGLVHLKSF